MVSGYERVYRKAIAEAEERRGSPGTVYSEKPSG